MEPDTMKRMVAIAPSSPHESYVEPSPYAWLRTRAPVPTTYAPACAPLYPFQEILENRTSRARRMTCSCTEVVERKFSSCIEIWQFELESCVWRVSFHKYAYVHGDPVQGIDPTGMFVEALWARVQSDAANLAALASTTARILGYHMMSAARIFMNIGTGAGGITGKVLNYSWLVGSVSAFWAALSAINGLRYMRSQALETFDVASQRLQGHLESSQSTLEGKTQAKRIALAIRNTYEKNSRFHFRAFDPLGRVEVSLQKGIFCAEWATAFRNTASYEIGRSRTPFFKLEREYSQINGDPSGRVHSWLKITPLNGSLPIYVDDAFSNGKFVHDAPPMPSGYSPASQLDKVQDSAWFSPPIYDSTGKWIDNPDLNPWNSN
jgi:hypothetical protein